MAIGPKGNIAVAIEAAALALVAERMLLPEDAERLVAAAKECDRF